MIMVKTSNIVFLQVEELERAQTVAITDVESAEVSRLQGLLTDAEDQINYRNKVGFRD